MTQVIPVAELLEPLHHPAGTGALPCGDWGDEQDGILQELLDAVANPLVVVRRQAEKDGETVEVAELKPKRSSDPGWNQVLNATLSLFRGGNVEFSGRSIKTTPSKHVGVAAVMTLAAVEVHGLAGLAGGFELLGGLMERFWDSIHPLPVSGKHFRRSNQIQKLQAPWGELNDGWRLLQRLSQKALFVADRDGPLPILLAVRSAPGAVVPGLPPGDRIPPEAAEGLKAMNLEAVAEARGLVDRAIQSVEGVVLILRQKVGEDAGIRFDDLLAVLNALAAFLAEAKPTAVIAGASPGTSGSTLIVLSGRAVTSRQDAMEAMASVARYLKSNDPASPVPTLLDRAARAIGRRFGELLRDLDLCESACVEFAGISGDPGVANEAGTTPPDPEPGTKLAQAAKPKSSPMPDKQLATKVGAGQSSPAQQLIPIVHSNDMDIWKVNSQTEAVGLLGAVSGYFRQHEPASPVPYLIQRAVGLVGRDFLSLLIELFAEGDATARFRALSGLVEVSPLQSKAENG